MKVNARWSWFKDRLRNNYWLLPGLMLFLSLCLGFVSLALDRELAEKVWKSGWLYLGGADGARSLLSSLAGATLTLAGVVFSMNLVSLTMASSQLGPRLLHNFVRDLGSQFTLGTFTAIFIFCMVILREVKGEDGFADQFIPHLSVTIAGIMGLGGMVVLIYFVHHVAVQIQAPVVVANVGLSLEETIKNEFNTKLEPDQERTLYEALIADRDIPDFQKQGGSVESAYSGYIQAVDFERLVLLACRYDLVLKLESRPGKFAIEGVSLIQVYPKECITDKLISELKKCVVIGRRRSAGQDIEFAINELCEVAVRAMSPGINDPFTCISCIDWLSAAVEELFHRDCPRSILTDDDDQMRLIWSPVTHEGVMDSAFNQIRQFGYNSPAVMTRLLEAYARIAAHVRTSSERESVRKHADMAMRACRESFPEHNDIADAEVRYRKVIANLAAGSEI